MPEGEKIGGYDSNLTRRAERKHQESIAYERGWARGEAEARPEDIHFAEYILSTVRLDELKDIFLESLGKSGVPAENANTAAIEKVFTRPLEDAAAAYNPFMNYIALSTRSDQLSEAKQLVSEGRAFPEELLFEVQLCFIHELCHAFSRVRFSSKDTKNASSIIKAESGYKISELTLRQSMRPEKSGTFTKSADSFEAFNEGVTQRIAEEVFLEYGKRIGMSEQVGRFLAAFNERRAQDLWRYSIFENQIDEMCEQIGRYTGVSKEVVWQSFKRGYFEKPQLFHEETIELFKETFGESFLEEHGRLGNATPVDALGSFDGKYDFRHPREYAERWLCHLGISSEPQSENS